jgi:hypothetical protein
LLGEKIEQIKMARQSKMSVEWIDISQVPAGTYILSLQIKEMNTVMKTYSIIRSPLSNNISPMKKISNYLLSLSIGLALITMDAVVAQAQAPQGINYQAVVRDNLGAILPTHGVGIRFTIKNGVEGVVLYRKQPRFHLTNLD